MRTIKAWSNNRLLQLAMLTIFLVIDIILLGRAFDLSKSDWATWVGSVGTVGTLIGTIVLARTETKNRRQEAWTLARVHAAGISMRVVAAEVAVSRAASGVNVVLAIQRDLDYVLEIKALLENIDFWTIDEIVPLTPIPSNTALMLIQAAQSVRLALVTVRRFEEMVRHQRVPPREDVLHLAEDLAAIARVLENCSQACQAATYGFDSVAVR